MNYREYLPSPPLRPFVHVFAFLEEQQSLSGISIEQVPPILGQGLLFLYSNKHGVRISSPEVVHSLSAKNITDVGVIMPAMSSSYQAIHRGCFGMFSVIFKPGQLQKIIGHSALELKDAIYSFDNIGSPDLKILQERVLGTSFDNEKILLVEQYISSKLVMTTNLKTRTDLALRLLHENHSMSIKELAYQTNLSHKQFRRLFKRDTGRTPKNYQRILRLSKALNLLNSGKYRSLIELSYGLGYYDQSHFNNEFFDFTGMTPLQYLKGVHPILDAIHWKEEGLHSSKM